MKTITTVEKTELREKGKELLKVAYELWQIHQKTCGPHAVVWLKDDNGYMVVFTRGEYHSTLMRNIENLSEETPLGTDTGEEPTILEEDDPPHMMATGKRDIIPREISSIAEIDKRYRTARCSKCGWRDLALRIIWKCDKCGREREDLPGCNEGGQCSCGGYFEFAGESHY